MQHVHKGHNISLACTVSIHETHIRAIVLDHILDDKNRRITRRSPQQPRVYLTARAHNRDYDELGDRLH